MKYNIKYIIGEGATGKVYKGTLDNKPVSIKIINKNKSKNIKRETDILKILNHENILSLIKWYETSTSYYIITELCEYNLIKFITDYKLDIQICKKIIRMILCGVQYLHSCGIIHRDIKLANILVKGNILKICDFGLSCYEDETGLSVCGTEKYMAPELLYKCGYNKSIDIYSTGKVFKSLLNICQFDIPDDCIDLLRKMVEDEPSLRISALEALQHSVFDSFIPSFCDFRFLPDFSVSNKFGMFIKKGSVILFDDIEVSLVDSTNSILNKDIDNGMSTPIKPFITPISFHTTHPSYTKTFSTLNIITKLHSTICNINVKDIPNIKFKVRGSVKDIHLFTNSELKKLNYGMAYLNLKMERLSIFNIQDTKYKYSKLLNNTFKYIKDTLQIKSKKDKLTNNIIYEITDKNIKKCYTTLPYKYKEIEDINYQCDILISKLKLQDLIIFLIKNNNLIKNDNMTSCSVNTYTDMTIQEQKEYKFISKIGWCIKDSYSFVFLLISGVYFIVNQDRVVIDKSVYVINNKMPDNIKRYLKSIKPLLLLYL